MSGYHQDLSTNIENSRNSLRRIATNDDTEFSRESIVNLMEKFVKTVNVMDETILVPCRLMDRTVGDATDTIVPEMSSQSKHHHHHHHHHSTHAGGKKKRAPIHESLSSAELFKLYNMLNGVKLDLLWGRNSEEQPEEIEMIEEQNAAAAAAAAAASVTSNAVLVAAPTNGNDSKDCKGHARRPSTASVASSNSATTLSDSDSEISTENDSGIESECKHETDKSRDLAKQYRKHLLGLYRCLEQMTDAANYLTARYQSDIGPV